jgi:hypothetical protein
VDEIDTNRAKIYTLIYLTASVSGGVVKMHPDVHGHYETWQAARDAKASKIRPEDYYICQGYWRKM